MTENITEAITVTPEDRTNTAHRAAVYGLAFGDAWGFVTEFKKHNQITSQHLTPPALMKISDDTQMSLYTMYAAETISDFLVPDNEQNLAYDVTLQNHVRRIFAAEHLDFFYDLDNDRAPGMTCMTALEQYQRALFKEGAIITGQEGSLKNDSKGCGTIMRSPWLGLITGWTRETLALLAILQSQTTHGHPSSWASAAVATLLVHDLVTNRPMKENGSSAYFQLSEEGNTDFIHRTLDILDDLTELNSSIADEDFITSVVSMKAEFKELLEENWLEFVYSANDEDVTEFFGEGWTADEALFTSVAVASLYRFAPYAGVKRLVWTSGDSDSIAALGGVFLMTEAAMQAKKGVEYVDTLIEVVEPRLETRYYYELQDVLARIRNTNSKLNGTVVDA